MKTIEQFIGRYPLSKTLRFSLRPVGKTEDYFRSSGILKRDKQKADDYPVVKKMIDECHKYLINESLAPEKVKGAEIDWMQVKEAIDCYRKDKSDENKKALENVQNIVRKQIFELLKKNAYYSELTSATPKDLLQDETFLETALNGKYEDMTERDSFKGFTTYFTGFQENRKNIYTDEAISTAVPYRAVHDNFPKFLADIEVYNNIKEICPEVLTVAEDEMLPYLDGISLDDVFSLDFYNSVVNQSGIDYFNQIIGGVTTSEGEKKLRGINEMVNLHLQQHPELKNKKKGLTMVALYKQILSDRETSSFIPQAIISDKEMMEIISLFHNSLTCAEINGEKVNVVQNICALLTSLRDYDAMHVYVNSKYLTDISQKVFKNWGHINDCLRSKAIEMYGDNAKGLKKVEAYIKHEAFSIDELSCVGGEWISYFDACEFMPKAIEDKYRLFVDNVVTNTDGNLRNRPELIEIVKELLDAYMDLLHKAECLSVSDELDIDHSFYTQFSTYSESLRAAIPLYTKVRNYLTQKPYDVKKFKLNFDAPTLCNGWDKNKERDNKAILLFKDGKSYIAITAPTAKIDWGSMATDGNDCYSKMVYKLLAGPNKMLPHVFFSKKGIETFKPSQYILDGYRSKKYSKGKTFDLVYLRDLIDFYKSCIEQHEDWRHFGFRFSPTESYDNLASFYNEINNQGYKVNFVNIATHDIDKLVNEGKLFLFQIYNKDYAEGTHGKKNLHTLYWENIFIEENLKNIVLKLNGEAELFYREESVTKPFVHKVGEKMLNKRDKSGMPIPDSVYNELYRFYNGKIADADLSESARLYKDEVVVKDVTHEIVKDRRYTRPQFQFHVPFTINYLLQDQRPQINEQVAEYLKDNPDVNIIGLDRGERHLIYLTLINQVTTQVGLSYSYYDETIAA